MDGLLRQHRRLRRELTQLDSDVATEGATADTSVLLDSIISLEQQFKELHTQLTNASTDENEDEIQDKCIQDSKQLREVKARIKRLEQPSRASTCNGNPEIRLPQINLPVFSGQPEDWCSFSDLFRAAVHDQPINDAQKFQYLKGALSGEAARLVRHLPVTRENYTEAWELLNKRYNNTRYIANKAIQRMLNIQTKDKPSIRYLLDTYYEVNKLLKTLAPNQDIGELIISNIILNNLETEDRQAWELSLPHTNIPALEDLLDFLEIRSRALGISTKGHPQPSRSKCQVCKNDHVIYKCPAYDKLSIEERWKTVQRLKLCYNCLSSSHCTFDCKNKHCHKCEKKHHTSLHKEQGKTSLAASADGNEVLLPTANFTILDKEGQRHQIRALLDSGSQFNLIHKDVIRRLHLKTQRTRLPIRTTTGTTILSEALQLTTDAPLCNSVIKCYVTDGTRIRSPSCNISTKHWSHLRDLQLADNDYYRPTNIDIILGSEILPQLLTDGIIRGRPGEPIAQNTSLGWVISGPTTTQSTQNGTILCQTVELMRKFWELEEVPSEKLNTPEEETVEQHFSSTTKRLPGGAYEVRYPFYSEPPNIGANRDQALKRFLNLENQLKKQNTWKDYAQVMERYLTLGHLIPVTGTSKHGYYLPHHAIFKDSPTTRLRIVFDGSSKSDNGKSINDLMMNGPKTQEDLWSILLRFRTHKIALCADIEQMYLQIRVDKSQQKFQRVLWRTDPNSPVREYQLTRVTFGMKSSPYLATRVLKQLANDEGDNYPEAAKILQRDFYVDDVLTGADTATEGQHLVDQLTQLLKAGGFNLRKWRSNESSIIGTEDTSDHLRIQGDSIKTLGLHWYPKEDIFRFIIQLPTRKIATKRTILADAARIFDPLGWLTPLTVRAKMLFQELWTRPISWDDPLPADIQIKWNAYLQELRMVDNISIKRHLDIKLSAKAALCGFCDASEKGYGAVLYLRTWTDGTYTTQLILAKSKVAPLKPITIPRLELCAAVLLAKLVKQCRQKLGIHLPVYLWSDSTVTLHWISQHPSNWKSFVAHRVVQIQEDTDPSSWHYVSTAENPADLISRGAGAANLISNNLWWTGPHWLGLEPIPRTKMPNINNPPDQRRSKPTGIVMTLLAEELTNRFSSLSKLLRVLVYVRRFIDYTAKRRAKGGSIQVCELRKSLEMLIQQAQETEYHSEIHALRHNKSISKRSSLLGLTPFIDDKGLLRIGGRLEHSNLTYDQKHQIILPRRHHLTSLIVKELHEVNLHANVQLLLNTVRQRYWIARARDVVRRIIYSCTTCTRHRARTVEQLMGQLPTYRVTPTRPFLHTGLDYCGPLNCREKLRRGKGTYKIFICVFVCMATKAVHLEPVTSLTTEAFLAALVRFTSRRGLPSDLYSDNGRNFVAANKYLEAVFNNAEQIENFASKNGVQWHFIPPYSPHMGGLWEASVKSLKYHLRRVVGQSVLTLEELTTILCQIEGCLNSRPLYPISNDPQSLEALTPGHFLIGQPINSIPHECSLTHNNLRSRYELHQKLIQDVWNRWQKEYLHTLQQKTKWKREQHPPKPGDLVVLKESTTAPQYWKLGRIISTHPDQHGHVRVVTVKTATGVTTRSIAKIVQLFPENDLDVAEEKS